MRSKNLYRIERDQVDTQGCEQPRQNNANCRGDKMNIHESDERDLKEKNSSSTFRRLKNKIKLNKHTNMLLSF